jgi:hypothetical protein
MKLRYYLILFSVLVCSSNLNAQNNLNRITGLSSTTASVAYSLRQLSTSYTGPLVRIKVNSLFYDVYPDATTYNFTLSSKISASISTYNAAVSAASANALSSIITAGTTNATVAIWYDQSGNAVHVLNASALATIITSGTINTMNGQPTINFTSTNSYLTSTVTVNYSSQTVATLNAAVQDVASTDYISGIISTGNNGGWGLCYDPTSTIKGYWIDASGSNGASSKENTKDAKIVTGLIGKTTDSYIYTNSQLKGNRTAQSVANGLTDNIYVGVRGNSSIRKFIGNISEVFMFPKTLTAAEQTSLETSQSIFLGPFVTITSSASGAVCAGTSVTFTATTYNFTGTPTYQWYKNSVAINGETSASYTTSTLANADQIYVTATPGYTSGSISTSNLIANFDAANYTTTSTRWNDLSTSANHMDFYTSTSYSTLKTATYSTDGGGSLIVNNNSVYGKTINNTGISGNGGKTMSAWVKFDAADRDWTSIASIGQYGIYAGLFELFALKNGSGYSLWLVYDGGIVQGTSIIPLNTWANLTIRANGSNLSILVNGVLDINGTQTLATTNSPIYLGAPKNRSNGGWDDNLRGRISTLSLYNAALSDQTILDNYNATKGRYTVSSVSSNSLSTTITAGPSAVVTVNGDGCINKTSLTTTSGLNSYAWYKDDVIISGITTNTLTPNASGDYKVVVSNGTCSNTSSVTTIYSCGKTSEGKMSPITSSTTLVAISGKINSTYGVDERGLILNSITPVTTGLILYLDAGNLSSYSGSGTNWTDLSDRGNNGTLVGGVTYNSSNQGSLVFNGNSSGTTDSYVSLPATTDFAFGSGDFTVEMWIYANSGNNVSTFISINSSSGYAALRLENYLSNNLDAFHSSDGASHLIGKMSTSITANKWTHLVFSRINGNAKIYLDGVEKLSYALVGSLVASGNSRIGSLPGFTDRNHSGNIAITRIYKGKGLTSTEVTTQFDLLKTRFGL